MTKNTIKDNIYTTDARAKIIAGIKKTCDLIKSAYGPSGTNVIVEEDLHPGYRITNDGKTIVDKVKLADPVENIGASIVKEAGDLSDKTSGDGRKTTMLLLEAILTEAEKYPDIPALKIKHSLDAILPSLIEYIDLEKKTIIESEVGIVAKIASENELLGNLIEEIYCSIGKNGILEVENSNTFETSFEIKEGIRFRNVRYIAPYMANDGDRYVAQSPKILITAQKIASVNDLEPIFSQLSSEGRNELCIVCTDIDENVFRFLAFTQAQGRFKTTVLKVPNLFRDWIIEDFAKVTGATIIGLGTTLQTCSLNDLGTCEKLISTQEHTTVIGIKDITEHINILKDKATIDNNYSLRLAWLNTHAAILKVGATSESELAYIGKKARDGVSASFLALQDGVVTGAGITLEKIAKKIRAKTVGEKILKQALLTPHNYIVLNHGIIKEPDLILDAALVVKNSLKNAVSIAGTVLTANVVITNPPKEVKENNHDLLRTR